jgi:lysosomal acid lipase/cholesteryl ester hydrolase
MRKLFTNNFSNRFFKFLKKTQPHLAEEDMTIEQLITSKGYNVEKHKVVTSDGYILYLFRILNKHQINSLKESVFFQHGLTDSSDGWVCNADDKCLPFYLAKQNYDIWLGNSRGNQHSRGHLTLSPHDKRFWNYSFHEMGLYDLPASLDYIYSLNGGKKIVYIGYSQGTIMLFAALTRQLEYFQSRISLFIALGPVATISHMESAARYLNKARLERLFERIKVYELLPRNEKLSKFVYDRFPDFGSRLLTLICEKNIEDNNLEYLPVYLKHSPAGTSYKSFLHFEQIYNSQRLQEYDYGIETNMRVYGSPRPSVYDLSTIKDIPIALFFGKNDKFTHKNDINFLIKQLGDNLIYYKIYPNMGHLTFILPKEVGWFNDVLTLIEKYK